MTSANHAYQNLLGDLLRYGDTVHTRNSETLSIVDSMPVIFDTVPLITIRKTAWKMAIKEMAWFMSGQSKCPDVLLPWWDGQLNPDGHYLNGYATQMRNQDIGLSFAFDQIQFLLEGLRNNPNSRRLVMSLWNGYEMAMITEVNQNPHTPTTCLPGFVKVISESKGMIDFDELEIGDRIWDGVKYVFVTNKVYKGKQDVFKYSTRGGDLYCTPDHKVATEKGEIMKIRDCKKIRLSKGEDFERKEINWNLVKNGLIICDGTTRRRTCVKRIAEDHFLHIGKNDYDYFDTPIKNMVRHYPSKTDNTVYHVVYDFGNLPKTYEREIPEKVFSLSRSEICDFLFGMFSANGYVHSVNGTVCITQTSEKMIKQIQSLLNYVGIRSYLRMSKGRMAKFKNGTYKTRDRYDLCVLKKDNKQFSEKIGFIQKYKMNNLRIDDINIQRNNIMISHSDSVGLHDVYDITVDSDEHLFWCNGFLVSNCHSTLVQLFVRNSRLYMTSYQRSADVLLGAPHNFCQTWALLLWFAHHANLQVGTLRWCFGDMHLYLEPSHLKAAKEIVLAVPFETNLEMQYHYSGGTDDHGVPLFKAEDFSIVGDIPQPLVTTKPKLLI